MGLGTGNRVGGVKLSRGFESHLLRFFALTGKGGYSFQSTKQPDLRFRALLTDGTREVHLERVAAD
jgi:hypothetical protein